VSPRTLRLLPYALALGIVGVFAWLFFQQASEQYVMDEADFAGVARAIAHTGRPVYYRGEDLPRLSGIWHPPLYQYTSGLWVWIFGTSHTALRSYGFFCAVLAAGLGYLVLRRLFPQRHPWLALVWLGLFLLHPYLVQSALLPDIDGTALVVLSLLVLWLAAETVVARRWRPATASVLFGVALGLAFLAKLTTPLALVPLVTAALALGYHSWRWALGGTALAAAVAAAVFCAVWGSISELANLSFTFPFTFTYSSAVTKSGHPTLAERLHLLSPTTPVMFWLTPLLLAVFAAGMLVALRELRRPAEQVVLLCAAYAITVFVVYNEITGTPFGFPKYYAPALGPALVVAVAPLGLLAPGTLALRRRLRTTTVAGIALALLAALSLAAYAEYRRRAVHSVYPGRPLWLLVGLGAAALVALIALVRPRRSPATVVAFLVVAALTTLATTNLGEAIYQSRQVTTVRYFPGELGQAQTVAEVRRLLGPAGERHARLLSAKDIGYESGERYYEDLRYLPDPARLERLLRSHPDLVIVTRNDYDYSQLVWPQAFALIRREARPIWHSAGGMTEPWWVPRNQRFTIWRLRKRPSGAARGRGSGTQTSGTARVSAAAGERRRRRRDEVVAEAGKRALQFAARVLEHPTPPAVEHPLARVALRQGDVVQVRTALGRVRSNT